jgi:hypothetical protein
MNSVMKRVRVCAFCKKQETGVHECPGGYRLGMLAGPGPVDAAFWYEEVWEENESK